MCTTHADRLVAEAVAKRLRLKRDKGMLRERDGLSAVESLAVSISCDAFAASLSIARTSPSVRRGFAEVQNLYELNWNGQRLQTGDGYLN